VYLPDFITSARRLLMFSWLFFCSYQGDKRVLVAAVVLAAAARRAAACLQAATAAAAVGPVLAPWLNKLTVFLDAATILSISCSFSAWARQHAGGV
jgi:hypothetical protein